jgi:hypothetical protein
MAKPVNTIGDRDYGRRTYASNKKYEEQRKLATNAHIDRVRRLEKHSEFKKPYLPDQSYPEMEGFNFDPDNPKWPGLPPGEPPTTGPVDPGGPIGPFGPWKLDPDKPPQFFGCQFPGNFRPNPVSPGKWSMGDIWIGSQDSIASIACHGPGHCEFSLSECNQKTNISGRPGEASGPGMCSITVWADKNPDKRKGNTIVIAVTMASGMRCATTVDIEPCPADPPIEWDENLSAQTISRNGQVLIAVSGGSAPFNWSVSGTEFSLANATTELRTNTLLAGATACGSATITVTDQCNDAVEGGVRLPESGKWISLGKVCSAPGPWTSDLSLGDYERISGKYKVFEKIRSAGGYSGTNCENFGGPDCEGCGDDRYQCGSSFSCLNTLFGCDSSLGCSRCIQGMDESYYYPPGTYQGNYCWLGTLCPNGFYLHLQCLCSSGLLSYEWVCL